MNSTGEPMDATDAVRARDALAAACAARTAARRASDERNRPRGYTVAQGLAFAAGFTAFGVTDRRPDWAGLLLPTGLLSLVAFLVLVWLGAHHGGVTRWFGRDCRPGRPAWQAWLLPLAPAAVGLLAAIPYGVTGWLVGFGLAGGADHLLRAARTGTA